MPEERKIRWSADGDWRIGEVEIANEQGVVVAKLTGRVSHAAIVDICRQMCEQLARQAPAGVDVGAWADIHGPAQGDLQRYVMETELEKSIVNQVARRGWVVEPPWLGEWNADVVARAYRLIQGAQKGDPIATTQLDRIRTGAMKGNAPCIEALAKFSAVGRMIAKGMSLDAVFAALRVPTEVGATRPVFRGRAPAPARPPKKVPPAPPPRRWTSAPPAQTVKKPTSLPTSTSSTSVATRILTSKSASTTTSPSTSGRRGMGWPSTPTTSPSPSFTRSIETRTFVPRAYTPSTAPAATLVTAAPIAQPYAQAYATQPYATQPYAQQPYATQPYQPQYQYPPMDSSGGGGGGGGGGGEEFPMDDLGDLEDSGDFNDLDDLSDPIPPPEGDDGWDEEEARAGANASTPEDDLAREPPPDDGSGERPFAAAPGGGGGAEAGGAMPDGTPESGAEVNNVTDGSDGGMGVEMVPDMGDDVYPDEGKPM